jgi:hypothetical protein
VKASPWLLIKAHYGTYVDARTGRIRWQDHAAFGGIPIAIAAVAVWRDVHLGGVTAGALLTASALLSALLFDVMLQISQRAMDWADSDPEPGIETTEHATYLRELSANAGYSSLVCIAAALDYVVALTSQSRLLEATSVIGLALGAHLIMVLLMVMKRVYALTEERLRRAHTGAGLPPRSQRPLRRVQ